MPLPSQKYAVEFAARDAAQGSGDIKQPVQSDMSNQAGSAGMARKALDAYLKAVQDSGKAVVNAAKDPRNQYAAVQTNKALMQISPGTAVAFNTPQVMMDFYKAGQVHSARAEESKAHVPVVKRPEAEAQPETVTDPGSGQSGYIRYLSQDALNKLRKEQNPAPYREASPNYVEISPEEQYITDSNSSERK